MLAWSVSALAARDRRVCRAGATPPGSRYNGAVGALFNIILWTVCAWFVLAVELNSRLLDDVLRGDWIQIIGLGASTAIGGFAAVLAAWLTMRHAAALEGRRAYYQLRAIGARISMADGIVRGFIHWTEQPGASLHNKILRMEDAVREFNAIAQMMDTQIVNLVRAPHSLSGRLIELPAFCRKNSTDLQYTLGGRPLQQVALVGTFVAAVGSR